MAPESHRLRKGHQRMSESKDCEICGGSVEGTPFTVVALTEPPRAVEVCAACAEGSYVKVVVDETRLNVDRDDYLRADLEDLSMAVQEATLAAENYGWRIEGMTLKAY